jgi:hypothetical protein
LNLKHKRHGAHLQSPITERKDLIGASIGRPIVARLQLMLIVNGVDTGAMSADLPSMLTSEILASSAQELFATKHFVMDFLMFLANIFH